jgi:predicted amidophosphoribosyltransferase
VQIPQLMVGNCPRCGKVYQKNDRNQCTDCSREMDSALSRCLDFLRRNHKSTNEQVSEAIQVSHEQILAWIKENRLYISDYPNLNYPCATCGSRIRKNKLCMECSVKLSKEIQSLNFNKNTGFSSNAGGFQIRERFGRV